MKKFLKKISFYCVLLLLFVVTINTIFDPANIFTGSGIETKIANYLSQGYNVANTPENMDERILQKNVIQKLQNPPSTILLGSSKIMEIGRDYYGLSCLNHGVSGASVEDMIAIYQLYIEKGYADSIKKIVINIDPWLFNKNNEQSRWKTLSKEYYDFMNEDVSFTGKIPLHKYTQLVSISYFQSSIKRIPKYLRQIQKKENIMPTQDVINNTLTRLTDGTIKYDIKYRKVTNFEIIKKTKREIAGRVYSMENYTELSPDIADALSLLVNKIKKNNTEIVFLLMPYNPIYYNHLTSINKYKIALQVEEFIKSYAKDNNITILGSFNPEIFDLEIVDFYDGMHLSERGISKVFHQFANP